MNTKALIVSSLALVAGISQAQIVNAGFEADLAGYQALTTTTPTGWSYGAPFFNSGSGSWDIRGTGGPNMSWQPFFDVRAPEGNQVGYFNEGPLAQQTGYKLKEGTSSLSVQIGNRGDGASSWGSGFVSGTFSIQLWAGGTVSNGSVSGGTLLSTSLIDSLTYSPTAGFKKATLDYTASSSDVSLGQLVTIRFAYFSGHQFVVDDVQFTEAVPEPASMLALGAGALALIRRRRKN